MRNLKVSLKLIVSFATVIVLAVIVAVAGIFGMARMNAADDELYGMNLIAIEQMGIMYSSVNQQHIQIRNLVIYDAETETYKESVARLRKEDAVFRSAMALYEPTVADPTDRQNTDQLKKRYEEFQGYLGELEELGSKNMNEEAQQIMDGPMASVAADMERVFGSNNALNKTAARAAVDSNTGLFIMMSAVEALILFIAVVVVLFLAFYISSLISKPLILLTAFMEKAGNTGDIRLSPADRETIGQYAQVKDEIGRCISSTARFVEHVTEVGKALETIAAGDLTTELSVLSDNDTMGSSLMKMVANLNNMFHEIKLATGQVASGSTQIANGAQALAQGSTEQSANIQEFSASLSDIADKTDKNAIMAENAVKLAGAIMDNAEKGSRQMDQMTGAVSEINQASQDIGKVIKAIDDIAFQTNILALNAAVEAARAGQHGKGFAVVADEVRSLAAKSAEAAHDTESLIANSMEKAEFGAKIATETAASLAEIVSGINESNTIIQRIAVSSEEQNTSVRQINEGIEQVSQVVQQNSATAEESASASEELSGQAELLEQLIARFKLKVLDSAVMPSAAARTRSAFDKTDFVPNTKY